MRRKEIFRLASIFAVCAVIVSVVLGNLHALSDKSFAADAVQNPCPCDSVFVWQTKHLLNRQHNINNAILGEMRDHRQNISALEHHIDSLLVIVEELQKAQTKQQRK